jgi:hypothetical protein
MTAECDQCDRSVQMRQIRQIGGSLSVQICQPNMFA